MGASTQKCRMCNGIAKHLKKCHQKNKEKTSFPDFKPLILQFDTFLIVYVIYQMLYSHSLITPDYKDRAKKEHWYLARKETSYLSHQCSLCQLCCTSVAKGDCIWITLGVFWQYLKHCRCFQTLKERVSLSRGAGSLSCQSLKDFLTGRTTCQCGSLMK